MEKEEGSRKNRGGQRRRIKEIDTALSFPVWRNGTCY